MLLLVYQKKREGIHSDSAVDDALGETHGQAPVSIASE
jgi:hypothetical protein